MTRRCPTLKQLFPTPRILLFTVLCILYLLRLQTARGISGAPLLTLDGHLAGVNSVSWTQDGTHLATASSDWTVRVWSLDEEFGVTLQHVLKGHSDWVNSVAWNKNGTHLATASDDNTVGVWLLSKTSGALSFMRLLVGHTACVKLVIWSPAGTHLASASADNTVRVWIIKQGIVSLLSVLECALCAGINSVAWSPDGLQLATASDDTTVRIWSTGDRHHVLLRVLQGHSSWVKSVVWSPDGRWLATAACDNTARVWSLEHAELDLIFSLGKNEYRESATGDSCGVTSVAWCPSGLSVASSHADGKVRLWSVVKGENKPELVLEGHSAGVNSVAWSPDCTHLATGSDDGTVCMW
mmetsp:Transcript_2322/g.4696  ORF Transcript_2322/g.4696 Transcript_2322/m.4696 type:complete len:354 (-) Transcript_2322:79-1140(-)|eukprot:CAMPEP_0118924126 /NCGR_PEP_ID=MMETSP1169-20130426/2404_1 /TAXON_ID=36882 /ORGANISM="Pyramimonas obovata, Strain CCMP722" /LENGTH=353 /DNA_ID=CAMNT_0006865213 /DNA_START=147 /DNA_END=1208 /DNA_ORIENTATION=-